MRLLRQSCASTDPVPRKSKRRQSGFSFVSLPFSAEIAIIFTILQKDFSMSNRKHIENVIEQSAYKDELREVFSDHFDDATNPVFGRRTQTTVLQTRARDKSVER